MPQKLSDEAVKKATGKDWRTWFALLDRSGARSMSHKEIARMLSEKHLQSGWWAQAVTVRYEYARGRRVTGETADAGFAIGATKTVPISPSYAWKFLTGPEGLPLWLGELKKLELKKGATYRTRDGLVGEIRSLSPGKMIRLTRQPLSSAHSSTLQIHLVPAGAKTSIRFHEERLRSKNDREKMKKHWQGVLKNLAESFARE